MSTQQEVRVWDPLVRIFHWTLVLAFFIAYFTEDDLLTVHVYAGYTVAGLVAFRLVWGLIGTPHARFRDFVYPPSTIRQFLRDTLYGRAKRYLGHNPAGGAMILLMLFTLILLSFSGIALYGVEEGAGPLASWQGMGESVEELLEEVHEFLANFMLLLVFVHVAGILLESWLHHENLVRSMITGRKRA